MQYLWMVLALIWIDSATATTLSIAGVWQNDASDRQVEITDCGDGTPCGRILWIRSKENVDHLDRFNPDPALRGRSLIGVDVLWGFKSIAGGWEGGTVYDTFCGVKFGSKLLIRDPKTLLLKYCLGPICWTNEWTRVSDLSDKSN